MKKKVLSLVTILALSTAVYAGGDVAPIEEVVETPVVVDESAFYIGAGIRLCFRQGISITDISQSKADTASDSIRIMMQGILSTQYRCMTEMSQTGVSTLNRCIP